MALHKNSITLKILLVSQDLEDEHAVVQAVGSAGFAMVLKRVQSEIEVTDALDSDTWSIVLIDALITQSTPADVIALLEARRQETPYLVMYGIPDVTAIEILHVTKTQKISKDLFVELGNEIVHQLKLAGERLKKRVEAEQGIIELMDAWALMLELRDPGTQGHTQRVTLLALRLARAIGIPKKNLINLQRGALLHDIGKMGIPDSILLKEGELTEEETVIMRTHPGKAYDTLLKIHYLQDVVDVPFCHHEKWDGTGYPRRIKGLEIPENARIFSICDVYDALTTKRPYRDAWTSAKALEYVHDQSGRYFDPGFAKVFLQMMKEGKQ